MAKSREEKELKLQVKEARNAFIKMARRVTDKARLSDDDGAAQVLKQVVKLAGRYPELRNHLEIWLDAEHERQQFLMAENRRLTDVS